MGLYGAN